MTTTTTTSVLGDWLSTVAVSVVTLGLLLTYLSKHVQVRGRETGSLGREHRARKYRIKVQLVP